MSLQVRCPLCGMQVNVERIKPRPIVAVRVTSKGRGGIRHTVIDAPIFILKRVYQSLMKLRFYAFEDVPVKSIFSLPLGEDYLLPLEELEEVI